eukprot:CAMPEP_0115112038 /NCGR_PEP_ID=MMETSP0227-20121206/40418_1 /TAXON_ID=89957 /ORGANISM="Polarella glacialis, Strain CCMP 1383" /LENGTH=127 /DNA_ID=CAMNT_0002511561 /DNA_START=1270 /DNA_END=1651 /DNA_ORIENTATION=-
MTNVASAELTDGEATAGFVVSAGTSVEDPDGKALQDRQFENELEAACHGDGSRCGIRCFGDGTFREGMATKVSLLDGSCLLSETAIEAAVAVELQVAQLDDAAAAAGAAIAQAWDLPPSQAKCAPTL